MFCVVNGWSNVLLHHDFLCDWVFTQVFRCFLFSSSVFCAYNFAEDTNLFRKSLLKMLSFELFHNTLTLMMQYGSSGHKKSIDKDKKQLFECFLTWNNFEGEGSSKQYSHSTDPPVRNRSRPGGGTRFRGTHATASARTPAGAPEGWRRPQSCIIYFCFFEGTCENRTRLVSRKWFGF